MGDAQIVNQRVHVCVFVHLCVNTANREEVFCRNSKLHQFEVELFPRQLHKVNHLALSSQWRVSGIDVVICGATGGNVVCEDMRTATVCVSTLTQRHKRVGEHTLVDTVRIFVNKGRR